MPTRRCIVLSAVVAAAVGTLVAGGVKAFAVVAFFAIVAALVVLAAAVGGEWVRDASARRFDGDGRGR